MWNLQTPGDFEYFYRMRLLETESLINNYSYIFFATVAYDALWTFAIALNKTNEMVGSLTREEILNMTRCGGTDEETDVEWEVVSLENFTYSNQLMGCIIRWNLERTDFVGVSVSKHYGAHISYCVYTACMQCIQHACNLHYYY